MSKQKQKKPRPQPPLVQLTEEQLEAIAEGLVQLTTFYTKFIEEQLISTEKLEKSIAISTPEKFSLDRLFIEI